MSDRTGETLHVLGRAAPGDPTTAAARAMCELLTAEGRPGRLAAVEVHGSNDGITVLRPEALDGASVVVHAVDGGEALAPVVASLRRARVHLVHHGSRPGSDRRVLRSLRGTATTVAAGDASAREELRGLGFGEPTALPAHLLAGALTTAAAAVDVDVAAHPGPHLLAVGPIAEARSLELLVDAFTQLLRSGNASAVLTICGPASGWYLERLMRFVLRRGLVACEVIEPADEATVLRRLQRCDVFVSLGPAGLDPYLWHAAARARVVAPRVGATAAFADSGSFVELEAKPTRDDVVRALRQAIDATPAPVGAPAEAPAGPTRLRDLLGVA